MKLGFVTAILPDLELEEVMKVASKIGYDCIEVMCWPKGKAKRRYAGVTHIDLDQLDYDHIKGLSLKYQVEISALGYYPNPLSPDEKEARLTQEHINKLIESAPALGLDCVNTFVGRDWRKSIKVNWPTFLEVWRPIITKAEEYGVKVGIENCPMSFGADEWPGGKNLAVSPAIWDQMFSDIDSDYFGLNFDPSHMILQHMSYEKAIEGYAEKFFHVHAKDVRIDLEALNRHGVFSHPNLWHTPKLPGMGDVNWGRFLSYLTGSGYKGAVCVEVEDRAYEGSLEDRVAALQQSYNYLRQFIPKR